ncbi:uncharacterized protein LOC121390550 isoform X2 [Gigantopelta aegis]|uniref:uncharacterized protein LOC121390550 isoform X2 n=1 Tax=Gigantopelta aegis TaxID=1735272 RepID=UPI001B8891BE|nr:uncharacterized protein LOC121390550 isoform X2 [Gigantopelta aegis]
MEISPAILPYALYRKHHEIFIALNAPRILYCWLENPPIKTYKLKYQKENSQMFQTPSQMFQTPSQMFQTPSPMCSAFILHLEHEGNTFKANVSGLTEGTNFLFRVFAQNPSGRSDPAATVCQTRSAPLQSGQMAGSSGLSFPVGIAVGVSIIVLLIIIALLIAALYFKTSVAGKRKAEGLKALFFQSANKSSERKGPEGIETQDSVTPGTQYETLGPTQPQTPVTYEKLQLYENQDFQKKSGKKPVNQDNIYVNDVDLNAMP